MTISKAEWEIMRVVWNKKETTSRLILEVLRQKTDWSASTVKTLLKRLVDKGYLTTEKQGKQFIYRALLNEEASMNKQADQLFDKFCQRKHVTILEHLIIKTMMTPADITSLQDLLSSKKSEAVSQVPCHCIPGQCHCKEHLEV